MSVGELCACILLPYMCACRRLRADVDADAEALAAMCDNDDSDEDAVPVDVLRAVWQHALREECLAG
jgi:hypothetical protein